MTINEVNGSSSLESPFNDRGSTVNDASASPSPAVGDGNTEASSNIVEGDSVIIGNQTVLSETYSPASVNSGDGGEGGEDSDGGEDPGGTGPGITPPDDDPPPGP